MLGPGSGPSRGSFKRHGTRQTAGLFKGNPYSLPGVTLGVPFVVAFLLGLWIRIGQPSILNSPARASLSQQNDLPGPSQVRLHASGRRGLAAPLLPTSNKLAFWMGYIWPSGFVNLTCGFQTSKRFNLSVGRRQMEGKHRDDEHSPFDHHFFHGFRRSRY